MLFRSPLLLGTLWATIGSYSLGLVFLAGFTLLALLISIWVGREAKRESARTSSPPPPPSSATDQQSIPQEDPS